MPLGGDPAGAANPSLRSETLGMCMYIILFEFTILLANLTLMRIILIVLYTLYKSYIYTILLLHYHTPTNTYSNIYRSRH